MNNIEKLKRILTKEFIEENIKEGIQVLCINVFPLLIKNGINSETEVKNKFEIIYKLIAIEGDGGKRNKIKFKSHLNLRALEDVDNKTAEDILSNIISNEMRFIEKRVKEEINQIKELDRLSETVKNKVQKQLDNKNKFKGEIGFKDGNLYVTSSGFKYMNTPHKPEVLVTPDNINIEAETVQITKNEYIELKKFEEEYRNLINAIHFNTKKESKQNVLTVEGDEYKSSIEYKDKKINCKIEKKPAPNSNKSLNNFKEGYDKLVNEFFPENKDVVKNNNVARVINLGSLTLQEKDGKLAVTDKNGLTRFI